ncbi:MAG: TolC family protein [Bacteroidaceae bacterium]|nr:TolC family protein [Bacteroidaceae bacterium]
MRTTVFNMVLAAAVWLLPSPVRPQQLSLDNAIQIAQENSLDAKSARFSFMASYWTYRSFKAELLPAINLSGGLMNFNHSLVEARNYDDGRLSYVSNNTLGNSLTLSIDQKIAATGGTVSLQSYLYRLDQFTYNEKTYNSQPLRVSYTQPLRTYNSLKWQKKTAPLEYEIAQKRYATSMQDIAIRVTSLFFGVLHAQSSYEQSQATVREREDLYAMAQKRMALGTTTKSEVLQMELSLLNARVSLNNNRITLNDAMYSLFSYLRVTDYEQAELLSPNNIPDLTVSSDEVMHKALSNTSHTREQRLQILNAEQSVAQAKSSRGIQVTLNGELGFTQVAHDFTGAYRNLRDNEVIGLSMHLPIFDWGVSKGRVRMAQSQLEVVKTQQEQEHQDYIQELRKRVMQFNAQPQQCRDALRAQEIADERYDILCKRYEAGTVSVTDLNTALQEKISAKSQYISQLNAFWTDYYNLQKSTLYDWARQRNIIIDIDELIKKQK